MRRLWWLPLVLAAVVDLLLVLHALNLPGAQVNRAVERSLLAHGCEEGLLVRTAGGGDSLSLLHVSLGGSDVTVRAMQAEFGPNGDLTASSRASIGEGSDVSTSSGPAAAALGPHPLLGAYDRQIQTHATWLQGDCLPLPNPRVSHLRAAGDLQLPDGAYHMYHGKAPFEENGHPIFQTNASVWMGVAPDGTLGFAVVDGTLRETGVDALFASVFQYEMADAAAASTAQSGPPEAARVQTYVSARGDIVRLLAGLGIKSPTPNASTTGKGPTV